MVQVFMNVMVHLSPEYLATRNVRDRFCRQGTCSSSFQRSRGRGWLAAVRSNQRKEMDKATMGRFAGPGGSTPKMNAVVTQQDWLRCQSWLKMQQSRVAPTDGGVLQLFRQRRTFGFDPRKDSYSGMQTSSRRVWARDDNH